MSRPVTAMRTSRKTWEITARREPSPGLARRPPPHGTYGVRPERDKGWIEPAQLCRRGDSQARARRFLPVVTAADMTRRHEECGRQPQLAEDGIRHGDEVLIPVIHS